MKYWRKMLLALFAVCLFAGMGFSADLSAQSICDPDCKDGMLFIGDMFYDGILCEAVYPSQNCPCENLNWPLDGAVWGCDFGFLNTGVCDVPTQQWGLEGFTPHKTVWSESQKVLFVSYMNHLRGAGSPLITALDLDGEFMYNINPYDFDDLFQKDIEVGAMALDDERHLLYVTNMDAEDASVVVVDVTDPQLPVKPLCDPKIDLCAICDCDKNYRNMDIVFYKDRLYVSYFDTTAENGIGYGDPMIAVFNANPDDASYGEQVDCINVVLDCPCIDANDSYFLASNLAIAEQANGDVIVFATYHPQFIAGDMAAVHALGISEMDYEDYVNRPLGVITATNMTTRKSIYTDLNSAVYREVLKKAGIPMCDAERINLRAIDVNPCGCGDCEDMVIYVTAMKYGYGTDCGYKYDWGQCPFASEFDFEKAAMPEQGYVFALTFNSNDCEVGNAIEFKDYKTLPKKDLGWSGWDEKWPWSPGDIVATSWVKENNVVVEAPANTDGTVTVTTTYLNVDGEMDTLGFDFMWDPAVLQFTSHKITKEGTAEEFDTMPTSDTPGAFSWDDILAEFQTGLDNLETLTLEMTFTPIAATDATVVFAGGEGIYGYECFETTGNGGGTDCPDIAYDPCDGVDLTEITSTNVVDPVLGAFTLEASSNPCCTSGDLCIYVNAEYEGTPVLWQFDGTDWTSVSTDVTESATFDGCSFDYQLCVAIDSDMVDSVDEWAVVEAAYGNPGNDTDTNKDVIDDEDNGTGGSGEGDDDSSSGCNVGFSAAALLFVVPLVSIFRKR